CLTRVDDAAHTGRGEPLSVAICVATGGTLAFPGTDRGSLVGLHEFKTGTRWRCLAGIVTDSLLPQTFRTPPQLDRITRSKSEFRPLRKVVNGQQRRAQHKEARRLEASAIDGCCSGHDRKCAPADRATLARRIRRDDLARRRTPDGLLSLFQYNRELLSRC